METEKHTFARISEFDEIKRKAYSALVLAREDAIRLARAHGKEIVTCGEEELRKSDIPYYKEYFARKDALAARK